MQYRERYRRNDEKKKKQRWLEQKGYVVLRFLNDEVLFDREIVVEMVEKKCMELSKALSR